MALAVVLAASFGARPSSAAGFNFGALRPEQVHVMGASVGMEDGITASVGYARIVRWAERAIALGGDVTMVLPDPLDVRLRLGAEAPALRSGPWLLLARILPLGRSSRSEINTMVDVGLETGVAGGYFGQRCFLAADLGIEWVAATHITHSDRYRAGFPGARDGWYSSTGATLLLGAYGGFSLRNLDVVLRVGQTRDLDLAPGLVPFVATLGVAIRR